MQPIKKISNQAGLLLLLLVLIGLTVGCAKQIVYTSTPAAQTVGKTDYEIKLTPLNGGHTFFSEFGLEVTNRSKVPLAIDWNKSRYFHNGQNRGRFIFAGINPEAIKAGTIAPDIIAAGTRNSKIILPFRLLAYVPVRSKSVRPGESAFVGGVLPAGKNTLRIVFTLNDREISETLTVVIRAQERGRQPGE